MDSHVFFDIVDFSVGVFTVEIIFWFDVHDLFLGIFGLFKYLFLQIKRISRNLHLMFIIFLHIDLRQIMVFLIAGIINSHMRYALFLKNHH